MLDPTRLRLLQEFARRGTMNAVADALGLTSSAVSQQLATLSREAGVVLFERVGRRVRLSAQGQLLAAHADTILDALEAAAADLRAARIEPRGELHVASFGTFAKTELVPAILRLQRRHPALRIIVHELETDAALEAVRSGACQLALVFAYNIVPRPHSAGLVALPLREEPVLLALPRSWRKVRNPFGLKRLAHEHWIVGSSGTDDHRLAERACAQAGFTPRIAHTIDDYDLLLRMVAAGLGVGFVPELGLQFPSAKTVVVRSPAGTPLTRRIAAVQRRGALAYPALQALLHEIGVAPHLLTAAWSARAATP